MTKGILAFFVVVHLIIGSLTVFGGWVDSGSSDDVESSLDATPLGIIIGSDSPFGAGLTDVNPLTALALAVDGMRFFLALVIFDYGLWDVHGLAGLVGTFLSLIGGAAAAWLFYQFARAVAGSLGFGR